MKPTRLITIYLDSPVEPLASKLLQASIAEGLAIGREAMNSLAISGDTTPRTLDDAITQARLSLAEACAFIAIAEQLTVSGQKLAPGVPDSFGRTNRLRKARQRRVYESEGARH